MVEEWEEVAPAVAPAVADEAAAKRRAEAGKGPMEPAVAAVVERQMQDMKVNVEEDLD